MSRPFSRVTPVAADADASVLVALEGVGKDYPKVSAGGDRLRTLWGLLAGHADIPRFRALQGVTASVHRGESLGLVGENGAGKSTLLKIIAGVVKPSAGSVRVAGRIGALLELGSGFHPEYTGRENIYLAAALMGLSRRETREKVDAIIAFADIGQHIEEPIKHYSSGMAVRLGFAVATALTPDILITDEVLAVGDESFQKKCIRWLERYLGDGGTLLLCSHSMYHVQTLCSRAMWLHEGAVRLDGDSFDVTREYLTYHEEKGRGEKPAPRAAEGLVPLIRAMRVERADGTALEVLSAGDDMVLQGLAWSPDGRAPVLLFGIVRADGTPVYGAHSNDDGFEPLRVDEHHFAFSAHFPAPGLLPGKYAVRVHALDPEGLRLFDTQERQIVVTGRTRDYGLVRLAHSWKAGTLRPGAAGTP
ncbi:MAG TPA: ABC transporter ATP-binding protein [Usitatibacteraceae bacterium]|nr:ABC transporter ATP-binding protein [Usitatibacteraceae bacterium]